MSSDSKLPVYLHKWLPCPGRLGLCSSALSCCPAFFGELLHCQASVATWSDDPELSSLHPYSLPVFPTSLGRASPLLSQPAHKGVLLPPPPLTHWVS